MAALNPLRIRAANYRTFEQLDLDLPAGCVGVLGLNGHGKSSIVNAIDLALFGPEGRSWAPYLTLGATSTELMVEVTFEHAGATYRVRRGYSARGAGKSTLDLEQADDTFEWVPLTLGSAKETQQLLEQILGFTRRTLRASSLLLQGDGAAFTEADPRDRKRILADALGLDRFEKLLAAVRRDRRGAEQEITRIDGRLQGVTREQLDSTRGELDKTIADLLATVTAATTSLATAETELERAAQAVQATRENEVARTATNARRDAAVAVVAALVKVRDDATEAERQAQIVRDELATLPTPTQTAALEQRERDLTAAIDAHAVAERAYQDAVTSHNTRAAVKTDLEGQAVAADRRMRELDAKVAHLELGELDSCPTCQQQLGVEARKATVGALRAEAQLLADEAQALFERAGAVELPEIPATPEPPIAGVELGTVQQQIRQARDADLQRSRLEERLAGLQRTIDAAATLDYAADLADAQAAVAAVDAELAALPAAIDITALEQAAVTARARIQAERDRLQTAEREKAIAEERLAQLTARVEQFERDLADRGKHQAEIDLLAILERAYGPDGIPALIVENAAIPSIELEANRILLELGGTTSGCRVELRTDRAKSDGGIRDDVLDVVVVTEAGERAYETFSGGERTRLNLALRIALARLLATRRGAESRLLAIDEPEYLDTDGTEALVAVLLELERAGVFDRVYLVSHVPALRDSFDVVLQVVKDETGRSRVEGQLEPVAA